MEGATAAARKHVEPHAAAPEKAGEVNSRFQTPVVATVIVSSAAIAWYVSLKVGSENFLFDSITSLGLMIAFYYALTGYACVIFYRRQLLRSARNFLQLGLMPLGGAAILTWLFVKGLIDFSKPESSSAGEEFLGLAHPFVIGVGFLLLGLIGALLWRISGHREFFVRRPETASDEVAAAAGADVGVPQPAG
jgi:amino acid transporter